MTDPLLGEKGACPNCSDDASVCFDHVPPASPSESTPTDRCGDIHLAPSKFEHQCQLQKGHGGQHQSEWKTKWGAPPIPSTPNPELEAALEKLKRSHYSLSGYSHAVGALVAEISRLSSELSRVKEEIFQRDVERAVFVDRMDELGDEISALRETALTQDEAAWLCTMIGEKYESISDRGISALAKIRRSSVPTREDGE